MILDDGPCPVGVESTIVSFHTERPALLRPGGIAAERIIDAIGPVDLVATVDRRIAPGQSSRHYAPATKLHIVRSAHDVPLAERGNAALLVIDESDAVVGFRCVEALSTDGCLVTAAANLFSALHRLDTANVRNIYAVHVPEEGLGRAIMDRLRRAAHD
jgi:L-threonylcarbamoyladenylate synthase